MNAVLIIGRILLAFMFINGGYSHFTKLEAMTGYAKYKKLFAGTIALWIFF